MQNYSNTNYKYISSLIISFVSSVGGAALQYRVSDLLWKGPHLASAVVLRNVLGLFRKKTKKNAFFWIIGSITALVLLILFIIQYDVGLLGKATLIEMDLVACDKKDNNLKLSTGEINATHIAKSPLDQFENRDLISLNAPILGYSRISLSNIGLYLTIATVIALGFGFLPTNNDKIVANNGSISQESIYATMHSIVINQINYSKGQIYFPFIYTLFMFILINNLIGMVPYSFASTSHFILTFFISFTVVLGATILGFQKHGLKLFSLFVPAGCPLGLLPLLVLIEFISYLARNVSLGLRLAANILSGHMLLNILSGFAYSIMTSGFVYFFVGLIPLAFIIAFSGLELGIAFIQAQVFVVLSSSYIKDALDLH